MWEEQGSTVPNWTEPLPQDSIRGQTTLFALCNCHWRDAWGETETMSLNRNRKHSHWFRKHIFAQTFFWHLLSLLCYDSYRKISSLYESNQSSRESTLSTTRLCQLWWDIDRCDITHGYIPFNLKNLHMEKTNRDKADLSGFYNVVHLLRHTMCLYTLTLNHEFN